MCCPPKTAYPPGPRAGVPPREASPSSLGAQTRPPGARSGPRWPDGGSDGRDGQGGGQVGAEPARPAGGAVWQVAVTVQVTLKSPKDGGRDLGLQRWLRPDPTQTPPLRWGRDNPVSVRTGGALHGRSRSVGLVCFAKRARREGGCEGFHRARASLAPKDPCVTPQRSQRQPFAGPLPGPGSVLSAGSVMWDLTSPTRFLAKGTETWKGSLASARELRPAPGEWRGPDSPPDARAARTSSREGETDRERRQE